MREAVGSGDHKTAAVMDRAMDAALWDAHGAHDPMVTAAMTQHSRSPTPAKGSKKQQEGLWCLFKKLSFFPHDFSIFTTLTMACASTTITIDQGQTDVWTLAPDRKTKKPPSL